MICPQCQTKYPHGQRFCHTCADENHRPIQLVEERVDPLKLNQYRQAVAAAMKDGFLEQSEKQYLQRLRNQLGVTEVAHQEMLNEYTYIDMAPIRIAYNVEAIRNYGAHQECLALLRVANIHDHPISTLKLEYTLNQKVVQQIEMTNIMPNSMQELSLSFRPESEGQFSLGIQLFIKLYTGQKIQFASTPINFQVASSVQPQTVHIHQTADNIVGNQKFGDTREQSMLLGSGQWSELHLTPREYIEKSTFSNSKPTSKPNSDSIQSFKPVDKSTSISTNRTVAMTDTVKKNKNILLVILGIFGVVFALFLGSKKKKK